MCQLPGICTDCPELDDESDRTKTNDVNKGSVNKPKIVCINTNSIKGRIDVRNMVSN